MTSMDNVSGLRYFTLSGLTHLVHYRIVLFALTLLCYSVIWLINVTLIVTIVVDRKLHEPMYIFLCNLCVNALYGTAGFYPKFLLSLFSLSQVISYSGCLLQSFVIHSSSGYDLSILAVMAYDRYVALCRPLMYRAVMTAQRVSLLVVFSWILPLFFMLINSMSLIQTNLCGSVIPKVYCSNSLISKLACSATTANTLIVYVNIAIYASHFVFVLCSYFHLVKMCRASKQGKRKFMQTCVPHLVALLNFAFAVIFDLMYTRFALGMFTKDLQNFMAIVYLVIPPIMNPLVYGFNLTKVRNRIFGSFKWKIGL